MAGDNWPPEPITKQRLWRYTSLKMEVDNQLECIVRLRNETEIPAMKESGGGKVEAEAATGWSVP